VAVEPQRGVRRHHDHARRELRQPCCAITNIIGYPFEDVSTLNVPGAPFLYEISGTVAPVGPPVAPVPVPASLPILAMAIGADGLLRRRMPGLA
jgi:hypothetical protein